MPEEKSPKGVSRRTVLGSSATMAALAGATGGGIGAATLGRLLGPSAARRDRGVGGLRPGESGRGNQAERGQDRGDGGPGGANEGRRAQDQGKRVTSSPAAGAGPGRGVQGGCLPYVVTSHRNRA